MLRLLLLTTLLLVVPLSQAQSWPQKPVRVIVPFAPGGASDLMPRLVGENLAAMWGQPVVIDNRPGAAGNIGMEAGAKSPPDGYTLLAAPNGNLVVNPHMYSKLAYDVFKDLAPVTRIAAVQNVLVVHPDVPAQIVKEFDRARAAPSRARSISPRRATAARRTSRRAAQAAARPRPRPRALPGRRPRDEGPPRRADQPDAGPAALGAAADQGGEAARARRRGERAARALPDVPTIAAAAGLPGFEAVSWYALMAPAGHAASEVIARSIPIPPRSCRFPRCASVSPAWARSLPANRPSQLAARIKAESERWGEVVRKANIKAD